jgi:lipoprotein-anchoring transpeptidase ErfK/SrfK
VSGSFLARLGASDKCLTRLFSEPPGKKWVEINLAKQQLFAWQGSRLILQSRISSGRNGRTPAGEFRAGPFKARIHYSTRYHRAPMPWSVQINGNVFVHGFTSVPNYPASHGCIRLPLTGLNPAKLFFEWVDVGTPVRVTTG